MSWSNNALQARGCLLDYDVHRMDKARRQNKAYSFLYIGHYRKCFLWKVWSIQLI